MKEKQIPRAQSPEEVGVSSAALAELVRDIIDAGLETHSLMVVRHGKVAYEQFREPFTPEIPHVMFSVSKSVTSCAVGFAVAEGLLRVEDKVVDYIPELRGQAADPNLDKLTVRHLLTMTSGKEVNILADKTKKQWVKDYADCKWAYAPGEGWNYSNDNIYMLCVILHRVSGQCVVDFLMPRLFEPLDIPRPFWEDDGCGVEAGGWGLYLTTESMAKFIMCYAQGGVFEGKQVIPADWVAASGAVQVMQGNNPSGSLHGQNGYGYCFWQNCVPNSFRADGVFSQFGLVFPEYDACVVTTGGEAYTGRTLDALFRHIPAIFDDAGRAPAEIPTMPAYPVLQPGPRNPALEEHLEGRYILFPATMQQLPKVVGFPVSMMPMAVFFMSAEKAGGIDKVRMRFQEDTMKFSWSEGTERNTVLCGMDGKARKCLITLGGVTFTAACCAAWEGQSKLHIWIRPLNSVAERRLTFTIKGRQVRMLPRSYPELNSLTDYIAPHALNWIPNPTLARLVVSLMDKITLVAEPMHFGFLR